MLRRIMWFVAGLLALAVIAAAIVPRDTAKQPPPTVTVPERTTVKADIPASPARARTISAHVGDHLLLTVESDRIDTVNVSGLDLTRPVSATTPAEFDTILDHSGRFDVHMQEANKTVGIVNVEPTS